MTDVICRRDLARHIVRVVSPRAWWGGPQHAAIAVHVARVAVEADSRIDEETRRFCSAASFAHSHRHTTGRELHAIVRSAQAGRAFQLLDELRLLRPLTAWTFGACRGDVGRDVVGRLAWIDEQVLLPSRLEADMAASARYAAWLTSIDRAAGYEPGPAELKPYLQARERALTALTAIPEQGFRAAMIAVVYWRGIAAMRSGHEAAGVVSESTRDYGDVKGGCAAALLLADAGHDREVAALVPALLDILSHQRELQPVA
jgi:hypothetical protein